MTDFSKGDGSLLESAAESVDPLLKPANPGQFSLKQRFNSDVLAQHEAHYGPTPAAISRDEAAKNFNRPANIPPINEESTFLDYATGWLAAPGEAFLAPFTEDYEDTDGYIDAIWKGAKVSGEAFVHRFTGGKSGDYGQKIMEQQFPEMDEDKQWMIGLGLDIVADPLLFLGPGALKAVQKGIGGIIRAKPGQVAAKGDMLKSAIDETMKVVGDQLDPATFGKLESLANKAKKGDRGARDEFFAMFDDAPELAQAGKAFEKTDVVNKVQGIRTSLRKGFEPMNKADKKTLYSLADKVDLKAVSLGEAEKSGLFKVALNFDTWDLGGGTSAFDKLAGNFAEMQKAVFKKAGPVYDRLAPKHTDKYLNDFGRAKGANFDFFGMEIAEFGPKEAFQLRISTAAVIDWAQGLQRVALSDVGTAADRLIAKQAFAMSALAIGKVTKVGSHFGRGLRSFGITVKGTQLRKEEEYLHFLSGVQNATSEAGMIRALNRIDGEANQLDELRDVLFASMDNAQDGANFLGRFFTGVGTGAKVTTDTMYEYYINAILSGPSTHMVNVASGAALVAVRPVASMAKMISATAMLDLKGAAAHWAEGKALTGAMFSGMADVYKMIRKLPNNTGFKTPVGMDRSHELFAQVHRPSITSENLRAGGMLGSWLDNMGNFIRLPGSALLKEDKALKVIQYRMDIAGAAARKTHLAMSKSGLSGKAAKEQSKLLQTTFMNNPSPKMIEDAIDAAKYYTFTNELGDMGSNIYKVARLPGVRWLLPFVRTPANIVKMGVRNTIFGSVFKDLASGALIAKGPVGDVARARLAAGTFLPGALIGQMDREWITGFVDQRNPLGKHMIDKGHPAYSIKVGDKWYSYERIEPLKTILGLMATYMETMDYVDMDEEEDQGIIEEVGTTMVAPFMQVAFNNYLLPQIGEIFHLLSAATQGDVELFQRQLGSMAASATVPQAISQTSRAMEGGQFRMADDYIQKVRSKLAGLGTFESFGKMRPLPVHHDLFGDPRHMTSGFGPDIASPIAVRDDVDDPLSNLVNELQVPFPRSTKMIKGIKLDVWQKSEHERLSGKGPPGAPTLRETMTQIIASDQWNMIGDQGKRALLQDLVHQYRQAASQYIFATDAELQAKVLEQQQAQARIWEQQK